jgi:hypothetical protein
VVREGEAEAQLIGMMTRAFRSGAATERAVRAWAVADDHVAELVAAVDWRRVRFAEQLLDSLGVPQGAVGPRARMLYWAAVGRLMMARPSERGLSDAEIRDLAAIMRSGADRPDHTDVYDPYTNEWSRHSSTSPSSPTTGSSGSGQGRSGERRMMMSPFGSRSGIS